MCIYLTVFSFSNCVAQDRNSNIKLHEICVIFHSTPTFVLFFFFHFTTKLLNITNFILIKLIFKINKMTLLILLLNIKTWAQLIGYKKYEPNIEKNKLHGIRL